MKLTEIFDKPEPIKWGKDGKTITGAFTVGEESYNIYFSPFGKGNEWAIEFVQKIAGKKSGKLGLTGTGKEFKVFSTVISGIRDWIKKKKPEAFEFEGAGKSRMKLYTRLVKLLVKSAPYKVAIDDDPTYARASYRLERNK